MWLSYARVSLWTATPRFSSISLAVIASPVTGRCRLLPGTNQPVSLNSMLISSSGMPLVSGKNAQKKMALVTLQITKSRKYLQPCVSMAISCQYACCSNRVTWRPLPGAVICPIIVLNAKLTRQPMATPWARVLVSKSSAGMTQDREPQHKEKANWKTQPKNRNSQSSECCVEGPTWGNLAITAAVMIKLREQTRLPTINVQRRPMRSMKRIGDICPAIPQRYEIPWYNSDCDVRTPTCL